MIPKEVSSRIIDDARGFICVIICENCPVMDACSKSEHTLCADYPQMIKDIMGLSGTTDIECGCDLPEICPICKGTGVIPHNYRVSVVLENGELPKCDTEYNPSACGAEDDTDNCYRGGWDEAERAMLSARYKQVVE